MNFMTRMRTEKENPEGGSKQGLSGLLLSADIDRN